MDFEVGNVDKELRKYAQLYDELRHGKIQDESDAAVVYSYAYFLARNIQFRPSDFSKAIQLLTQIEESDVPFPLVAYGKALVYWREKNFEAALETLDTCEQIVAQKVPIRLCRWPGESGLIPGCKTEQLKELTEWLIHRCRNPPSPFGVCRGGECETNGYRQALMYLQTSEFNGMASVICTEDCRVQFHQRCWRGVLKEKSVSGAKDLMFNPCWTPDCNGKIKAVEIYESTGELKTSVPATEPTRKCDSSEMVTAVPSKSDGRKVERKKRDPRPKSADPTADKVEEDDNLVDQHEHHRSRYHLAVDNTEASEPISNDNNLDDLVLWKLERDESDEKDQRKLGPKKERKQNRPQEVSVDVKFISTSSDFGAVPSEAAVATGKWADPNQMSPQEAFEVALAKEKFFSYLSELLRFARQDHVDLTGPEILRYCQSEASMTRLLDLYADLQDLIRSDEGQRFFTVRAVSGKVLVFSKRNGSEDWHRSDSITESTSTDYGSATADLLPESDISLGAVAQSLLTPSPPRQESRHWWETYKEEEEVKDIDMDFPDTFGFVTQLLSDSDKADVDKLVETTVTALLIEGEDLPVAKEELRKAFGPVFFQLNEKWKAAQPQDVAVPSPIQPTTIVPPCAECPKLREANSSLQTKSDAATSELNRLRVECAMLNQQVASLTKKIAAKDGVIHCQDQSLQQAVAAHNSLHAETVELRNNMSDSQGLLDRMISLVRLQMGSFLGPMLKEKDIRHAIRHVRSLYPGDKFNLLLTEAQIVSMVANHIAANLMFVPPR